VRVVWKRPVMSPLRWNIARLMIWCAAIAVVLAGMRFNLGLGCLVLGAIVLYAGREFLVKQIGGLQRRTVGRGGVVCLALFIAAAPYILFFDPVDYWPHRGHVARDPLAMYLLFSDDVPYISASCNWQRTVSNLFVPHNTHILPAWRVVTWALVRAAGSLAGMPEVLAVTSYSILIAVMILTARLVARETGRTAIGLAAMALVGTTSVMLAPATWYSAGQTLWAGFGILATLWYAQSYRRTGNRVALIFAGAAAVIAGWFWTIGHVAGPAAAVYLWTSGGRRCRLAAIAPISATVFAVGLALGLGGRQIDSTISFHGRDVRTAANPVQGLLHTCQAIPENLVFANLGLSVQTAESQGVLLSLCLFLAWCGTGLSTRRNGGGERPCTPLEWTGGAVLVAAYIVEWTFRGYMDYQFLRTINLRFVVPWYDAVPQIGGVLLLAGWWNRIRIGRNKATEAPKGRAPTQLECVGVCLLVALLIGLNRPRVEELVRASVPPLLPSERKQFAIERLQTMRANVLLIDRAALQRQHLGRLDQCAQTASRMGWGRDTIRAAFGHRFIPGAVGVLRADQNDLYDAAALLDLPDRGRAADLSSVRAALGELYAVESEPRPRWILPDEKWPPVDGGRIVE
jgi:hypothetical protein